MTVGSDQVTTRAPKAPQPVIALFNANDDTVDMVKRMLGADGYDCRTGCHFADLKKGLVDFGRYLHQQNPDVVIIDISPPYAENWDFFSTLRDDPAMVGRTLVLTTTNKARLDDAVGGDSDAFELVGKPYDLDQIKTAIVAAVKHRNDPQR